MNLTRQTFEQDDRLDAQTHGDQSGDGESTCRYVGGDIGEELAAELGRHDRKLENEDGDGPGNGDNVSY